MQKYWAWIMLPFMATSVEAIESDDLKISGHFLGLYNYINQTAVDRVQFDFAANLDVEFRVSEKITGLVQYQGGTGDGSLGFVGPEPAITDINLEYQYSDTFCVTFGSYDTPFGEETYSLTNNADSLKNTFLSNPLLYSALAGPTGTLNTLGVKGVKQTHYGEWILSLTNGTGESAVNNGNTFEYLIGFGTDKVIGGLKTTVTYMRSDDRADATSLGNTSFEADVSGWITDAKYSISTWTIKGYVGELTYGDHNNATNDGVAVSMLEVNTKPGKWFAGARFSTWAPHDHNGDSVGMSSKIPNPGFAKTAGSFTEIIDTHIVRYQVGGGYQFEENMWLKGEILIDDYAKGQDVQGAFVYVNASF